jgi:hypothetical protein
VILRHKLGISIYKCDNQCCDQYDKEISRRDSPSDVLACESCGLPLTWVKLYEVQSKL